MTSKACLYSFLSDKRLCIQIRQIQLDSLCFGLELLLSNCKFYYPTCLCFYDPTGLANNRTRKAMLIDVSDSSILQDLLPNSPCFCIRLFCRQPVSVQAYSK